MLSHCVVDNGGTAIFEYNIDVSTDMSPHTLQAIVYYMYSNTMIDEDHIPPANKRYNCTHLLLIIEIVMDVYQHGQQCQIWLIFK